MGKVDYESELQPRHPNYNRASVSDCGCVSWRYYEEARRREGHTTMDTFNNSATLQLGFGHSANARRSLVVHVLVG